MATGARTFFVFSSLLAACGSDAVDPCGSARPCIALRVEGTQSDLDQLAVAVDKPIPATGYSPTQPASFALPAKVPLHLGAGASGKVEVDVRALAAGRERAHGHGTVTLDRSGYGRLTVTLGDGASDLGPPCSADLAVPDVHNCGACGVSCATGICDSAIVASMATAPAAWTLNGGKSDPPTWDATNQLLVLNKNAPNQSVSMIYKHPLVADAFTATFQLRVTWDTNTMTNPNRYYGDGLGFVLIRNDPSVSDLDSAVSREPGSALGMIGLRAANSDTLLGGFGVELDTYGSDYMNANGACGESTSLGEHVNIDSLALCPDAPAASLPLPLATAAKATLADGKWHQATIRLAGGALSVWLDADAASAPPLVTGTLPNFAPGDGYFIGFTAATGSRSEEHAIKDVRISFGKPQCL
jgi:hypothetical protein